MGQDIPKQFINVYDKPGLIYTLESFQRHEAIDDIVVSPRLYAAAILARNQSETASMHSRALQIPMMSSSSTMVLGLLWSPMF